MTKMKRFKKVITEGHGAVSGGPSADASSNLNMQDYANPAVLRALNSFVGIVTNNYVLPENAIGVLRNYLSKVQLTFGEVPVMEGESGSVELPLSVGAGRFGKGIDTPYDEFEEDDGISHIKEGGLTLVLNYKMNEDNSYRLTASVK
jgi:hypothetical protein|tara:strand:- start:9 stop:449 length:441 start_codon:yes stop_codon:yes gene_type:complete